MRSDPSLRGKPFNFSLEAPISALEIVHMVLDIMNSDLLPDIRSTARDELAEQYLDSSAARSLLGWQAEVSLREGLARTVDWYAAHG